MVGEESISVQKVWSAKRIKQSLLLRGEDFNFLGAPCFHGLDARAYLIPAIGHPLLVFLKRLAFDKRLEDGVRRIGRYTGKDLRGCGGAPVEFHGFGAGPVCAGKQQQADKETKNG